MDRSAESSEAEEETCEPLDEEDHDQDDDQSSGSESNEQSASDEDSECESEEDPVSKRRRADLPLSPEPGSGQAVAQLEKDIRAASKPLTVEPPCTTRYHRILVVSSPFFQSLSSQLLPKFAMG